MERFKVPTIIETCRTGPQSSTTRRKVYEHFSVTSESQRGRPRLHWILAKTLAGDPQQIQAALPRCHSGGLVRSVPATDRRRLYTVTTNSLLHPRFSINLPPPSSSLNSDRQHASWLGTLLDASSTGGGLSPVVSSCRLAGPGELGELETIPVGARLLKLNWRHMSPLSSECTVMVCSVRSYLRVRVQNMSYDKGEREASGTTMEKPPIHDLSPRRIPAGTRSSPLLQHGSPRPITMELFWTTPASIIIITLLPLPARPCAGIIPTPR